MEIPIYFSFKEFKENYEKDLKKFKAFYIDSTLEDFLIDRRNIYAFALESVTLIDVQHLGLTNKQSLSISELKGISNIQIDEKLQSIQDEYSRELEMKKWKYSFSKIVQHIENELNADVDYISTNKIKSKLTNIQAIGYLFTQLINNELIVPKRKNGSISPLNVARMILEHFEFEDLEKEPTEEDIRKALFSDNKLSDDKRNLLKLPTLKQLNSK